MGGANSFKRGMRTAKLDDVFFQPLFQSPFRELVHSFFGPDD